jgi:hypothetical protein
MLMVDLLLPATLPAKVAPVGYIAVTLSVLAVMISNIGRIDSPA